VRGGAVEELFLLRGGAAGGFKQAGAGARRGGAWAAAGVRHEARIGPSVGGVDGGDGAGQVADVGFGAESLGCVPVDPYGEVGSLRCGEEERSSVGSWTRCMDRALRQADVTNVGWWA
jgi:hypothetical protein